MKSAVVAACLLACAAPAVQAGELTLFATGEDFATEGFNAPELTMDGWALEFTRIIATFDEVTAWQTDPPFTADGPEITGTPLVIGGPFTVELVDADENHQVELVTVPAEPGHYNALSWTLVPAPEGEFEGFSLVMEGVARRDGEEVAFTLATRDAVAHACGEHDWDARMGRVAEGGSAPVEVALHIDQLFGRADMEDDAPENVNALGFAPFAGGGMQEFSLDGLLLGHNGEIVCHHTPLTVGG